MNKLDKFILELKSTYTEYIFDKIINDLTDRKDIDTLWYSIERNIREEIKNKAMLRIEQGIDKAFLKVYIK